MTHAEKLDDPSIIEADQVARALGTDLDNGLSSQEAARRLAADGPNELRAAPPVPTWRRVLAQFQDPLVYLLLVAVGDRARRVDDRRARQGWPVDAIVIAVVVVLNAVLG